MQKLQDSMDGLLSRRDLGEYERARQYIQLQNKYLTFKQQLNSRSKESSLPYSEEQREMSSNLLADNAPTFIQEPVVVTVNLVQTPLTLQAVAGPVQTPTVQTPVTVQATPVNVLPPSSILTPSPTADAPSQKKRKRPRIPFVNYLEEDDRRSRRPGVFAKVILTSILKKRTINCFVLVGQLKKKLIFLVNICVFGVNGLHTIR